MALNTYITIVEALLSSFVIRVSKSSYLYQKGVSADLKSAQNGSVRISFMTER